MCGEYNDGENEIAKNKEDSAGEYEITNGMEDQSVRRQMNKCLYEQIGWISVGMIQWTKWMNVWMNETNECFPRPSFEWTNEQGEGAFACENEPWFDKNYSISDNKKDEWVAASRSLQPPTP